MAQHLADNAFHGGDHTDTHASANRWRHQESSSFARHAAPRAPDSRTGSNDLASFLNSTRVDPPPKSAGSISRHQPLDVGGVVGPDTSGREGVLEVKCGPLLNYRRMEHNTWFGSVLVVTRGGGLYERPPPVLILKAGIAVSVQSNGVNGLSNGADEDLKITGTKLYSDPNNTFWRFDLEVPMQRNEIRCDYSIPGLAFPEGKKTDKQSFYIPAITESMRIMFHSCNGFSVGTDEEAYSGACLWNDVQRTHKTLPFHVM